MREVLAIALIGLPIAIAQAADPQVREVKDGLEIETDCLVARVNAKGYVSGVAANSLLDKKTGARDLGFGLHIMDFLLAPGWAVVLRRLWSDVGPV